MKKKRRTCREIYFVLTTSRVKPCPRLKISMSELDILFLRRLDYSKLFFCQRRQKINSILNSLRYRTRSMFSEKSWDSMLILSIWFFSLCLPFSTRAQTSYSQFLKSTLFSISNVLSDSVHHQLAIAVQLWPKDEAGFIIDFLLETWNKRTNLHNM